MIGFCSDCPKRETCTELCKQAAAYVDGPTAKRRERTIGLPKYGTDPWAEHKSPTDLTKTQRGILTLLGKGTPRADIAQLLGMSRQTLRRHISDIKAKYIE